ncbi:hypothetical protein [Fortiea contorta]|uniref:hypothetical protein n=1 Tax=Fortiea contorta TaxID=1892405 RepID=UPI0003492DB7|nr:hypothetical protein [Fortiea contorta]
MNALLYQDWGENPPRIELVSLPMPSAPYLPLTGGGCANTSVNSFINDLNKAVKNQSERYFTRVWGYGRSDDEADIYTLQTWQICTPEDKTYEVVILLYYAPINQYLTLKKHFGEEDADRYLEEIKARNAAITALSEVWD